MPKPKPAPVHDRSDEPGPETLLSELRADRAEVERLRAAHEKAKAAAKAARERFEAAVDELLDRLGDSDQGKLFPGAPLERPGVEDGEG